MQGETVMALYQGFIPTFNVVCSSSNYTRVKLSAYAHAASHSWCMPPQHLHAALPLQGSCDWSSGLDAPQPA